MFVEIILYEHMHELTQNEEKGENDTDTLDCKYVMPITTYNHMKKNMVC